MVMARPERCFEIMGERERVFCLELRCVRLGKVLDWERADGKFFRRCNRVIAGTEKLDDFVIRVMTLSFEKGVLRGVIAVVLVDVETLFGMTA